MGVEIDRPAVLETRRLRLTAIRVADAEELAGVLGDARLHEFIGGRPLGVPELRARYRRWVAGSGHPDEVWLNWVVRRRAADESAGPGEAVGTVQATVTAAAGGTLAAEVAWVIGLHWQGRGFAAEAAAALVAWLTGAGAGVAEVTACIHPRHRASERVAERVGFVLTAGTVDGERVWRFEPAVAPARS
jgi:RimJ/RimL family protein N-acetyltransferase